MELGRRETAELERERWGESSVSFTRSIIHFGKSITMFGNTESNTLVSAINPFSNWLSQRGMKENEGNLMMCTAILISPG